MLYFSYIWLVDVQEASRMFSCCIFAKEKKVLPSFSLFILCPRTRDCFGLIRFRLLIPLSRKAGKVFQRKSALLFNASMLVCMKERATKTPRQRMYEFVMKTTYSYALWIDVTMNCRNSHPRLIIFNEGTILCKFSQLPAIKLHAWK